MPVASHLKAILKQQMALHQFLGSQEMLADAMQVLMLEANADQ